MDQKVETNLRPARAVGPDARQRQSRFYFTMGLIAVAVVIAGFGHSFYGDVTGSNALSAIVHIHTAVFVSWLIFFLVQIRLVASQNIRTHMTLGYFGTGLAVVMVIIGTLTAIAGARRGFTLDRGTDPLSYMAFPLGNLLAFAVMVGLAYRYRRRPEVHRRLMLLATVGPLMSAPLAHLFAQLPDNFNPQPPIYFLLLLVALLFACAVYDRLALGRFNRVSLWTAVAMFAWGNVIAALIVPSAGWHRFAEWLTAAAE